MDGLTSQPPVISWGPVQCYNSNVQDSWIVLWRQGLMKEFSQELLMNGVLKDERLP